MLSAKVIRKKQTNYPKAFAKVQQQFLPAAGAMVEGAAKALAAVDQGQLRGSIGHRVKGEQAEVFASAAHAPDVEYGTRPHTINSSVYINRVGWRYIGQHPGTKAQPFMRPALDENRRNLVELFRRDFRRTFSG